MQGKGLWSFKKCASPGAREGSLGRPVAELYSWVQTAFSSV
jgi:hypothetical protein